MSEISTRESTKRTRCFPGRCSGHHLAKCLIVNVCDQSIDEGVKYGKSKQDRELQMKEREIKVINRLYGN